MVIIFMFIKEFFYSQVPNCRVGGAGFRLDGSNYCFQGEGDLINPKYVQ